MFIQKINQDVNIGRFHLRERMLAHLGMQIVFEILFFGDVAPNIFGIVAAQLLTCARHGYRTVEPAIGKLISFRTLKQRIVQQPVFHFALKLKTRHLQDAQRLLQPLVELLGLFEFKDE